MEDIKMRKIVALLLAAIMVFGLCACGSKTAEPGTAPAAAADGWPSAA